MKMPNLEHVPLRKRFIVSMVLMLLPFLVFAVGGMLSFEAMIDALDEIVEEASEEMYPIMQLQTKILKSSMLMHNYIIGYRLERERFINLSLEIEKGFEDALSSPYGLSEENKMIRIAYKEWQSSRSIGKAILEIPQPVGAAAAARGMKRYDSQIDHTIDVLDRAHDLTLDEIDKHLGYAQNLRQRVYIVITFIFIVGLAAAIFTSIKLLLSILNPLSMLEKATEHLAEGDLACRVPFESNDELGALAKRFNIMAARLENSQVALEEIATHDDFTGVYNRREFYQRLRGEIKRFMRYGHLFSVLIVDLDFLKDVNDTYGHQAGDKSLQVIASIIRKEVRPVDTLARYGGDEFVLILPETPISSAIKLAERICSIIAALEIQIASKDTVNLTVSIGVVCFPEDGKSENELISAADNMLYAAKGMGRNQVYSSRRS